MPSIVDKTVFAFDRRNTSEAQVSLTTAKKTATITGERDSHVSRERNFSVNKLLNLPAFCIHHTSGEGMKTHMKHDVRRRENRKSVEALEGRW